MREESQSVREVLSQCREYDDTKVLDSIRFLIDNGVIQMDGEGKVRRKGK